MTRKSKYSNKSLHVNDDELYYEIKLSQGRGILSEKAKNMFVKIGTNFMYNFHYYNNDYKEDCFQSALEMMLNNWHKFNTKKYTKALPYMSELAKRGATKGFNEVVGIKKGISLDIMSIHSFNI